MFSFLDKLPAGDAGPAKRQERQCGGSEQGLQ
jgi:hypothetical protein